MTNTEAAYIAGIIDGEGTITLTKLHSNENRKPVLTIASTDIELLHYLKSIVGGKINREKNYSPDIHKNSYTLIIKNKNSVFKTLREIIPYLKVPTKIKRAKFIIENYEKVTIRNGRYNEYTLKKKKNLKTYFLFYRKKTPHAVSFFILVEARGHVIPCFRNGTDYILNLVN